MQLRKVDFFCLARGVPLDNGVTSPWSDILIKHLYLSGMWIGAAPRMVTKKTLGKKEIGL